MSFLRGKSTRGFDEDYISEVGEKMSIAVQNTSAYAQGKRNLDHVAPYILRA